MGPFKAIGSFLDGTAKQLGNIGEITANVTSTAVIQTASNKRIVEAETANNEQIAHMNNKLKLVDKLNEFNNKFEALDTKELASKARANADELDQLINEFTAS